MEVLAACHVHSNWSYDGTWSLQDLNSGFRRRGYRVLMMTEHDRGFTAERFDEFRGACAKASTNDLLIVPGIEYSDAENRVHVLVWGLESFLGEGLPTIGMLQHVQGGGGVAVLAHPSRRDAWKCVAPSWTDKFLGIEAWNRKYDGWAPSQSAPDIVEQTGAVPFVGLDFHTHRQFFPLGMVLELPKNISEETVLDALRRRHSAARVFGMPLRRSLMNTALPLLKIAERSRKAGVSLVKRSKRRGTK